MATNVIFNVYLKSSILQVCRTRMLSQCLTFLDIVYVSKKVEKKVSQRHFFFSEHTELSSLRLHCCVLTLRKTEEKIEELVARSLQ